MFEEAIITYLKSVANVTATVGTYASSPAIFSYEAPENCDLSYITVRIESSSTEGYVSEDFNMFIDYYDYNKSRLSCRNAARNIVTALDQKWITHEDYPEVRLNYFAGSFIESDDSRDINYNLQFSCRAVRTGYMVNR